MASKPSLLFFTMLGCPHCTNFKVLFDQATQDPEVRALVQLEEVSFGYHREEHAVYSLEEEFPDLASKVEYAPFIWLHAPYDEKDGHHLSSQKQDPQVNKRLQGKQYQYRKTSTYQDFKEWILKESKQFRTSAVRVKRPR